jgi:hypothetical protein
MVKHEIQKSKVACFLDGGSTERNETRRQALHCARLPLRFFARRATRAPAGARNVSAATPTRPPAGTGWLRARSTPTPLSLSPPRPTRPRNHARARRLQQPLPPSPSPAAGGVVYCTIA